MPNPRNLNTILLGLAIAAAAVFLGGTGLALAQCMTDLSKGLLLTSAPVLVLSGAIYIARR